MPVILNRTEETWEFGTLRVPPGETVHSTGAVEEAMAITAMAKHVVMADDLRAPQARFVLDMHALEPRPAEVTEEAKELLDELPPLTDVIGAGLAVHDEPLDEREAAKAKLMGHSKRELAEMAAELDISVAGLSKAKIADAILDHG